MIGHQGTRGGRGSKVQLATTLPFFDTLLSGHMTGVHFLSWMAAIVLLFR